MEARVIDRFGIDLSAHGPLRPGRPIRISARVTAAVATPSARIEITLPDVEVARHITRVGRGPALGTPLAATTAWEGALGAGQSREVGTVIEIAEPGYYRMVATAVVPSGPEGGLAAAAPSEGPAVRNAAVEELWLLVDETRGSLHARRWLSALPDSVERAPGPYRARRRHHQAPDPAPGDSGLTGATLLSEPESPDEPLSDEPSPLDDPSTTGEGTPLEEPSPDIPPSPRTTGGSSATTPRGWYQGSPGSYNEIAVAVAYYHPIERAFRHAGGVPVTAEVWRREAGGDRRIGGYEANTAMNGGNLFPCSPNDPDEYMVFRAELSSGVVSMPDADPSTEVVATNRECGLEYQFLESDAPYTQLFLNLSRSAAAARSVFSAGRPSIEVVIDGSFWTTASRYSPNSSAGERISIIPADVWDEYGTFIQAHEYGHAFHQRVWGGIVGGCSGSHQIDQPSSLGCAYSEGIADFFSFVTMPTTWMARNYSGVTAAYGTDRSTTEVHVAAFLTRLVDSAIDPARPWDRAQFPGRYVGETIRTCTTNGVSPARADGIDRLIYCLERGVDPRIRDAYFTSRANASRITTQASGVEAPLGWNRAIVRTLWEKVLYGQEWTYYP